MPVFTWNTTDRTPSLTSNLAQMERGTVNKQDLAQKVAGQTGTTQAEAQRALDATLDAIVSELVGGGEVNLAGFGKFTVAHRKAREGRNPATGATIQIAASKAPKFSALGAFKKAVKASY